MKKVIIQFLVILFPLFALAQTDSYDLKDFAKKAKRIVNSFKFNEDFGVYQIQLNDKNFKIIAVDNKLKLLWEAEFVGNGIACGKFKDNILAIADSGLSYKNGHVNPYAAYLIDPLSGKTIVQNEIFNQKAEHKEIANAFFANDGADFNLVVRQTNRDYGFFTDFKDKTEDLTIINLNEKLEPTYIKPKFLNETFVSLTCNSFGDLFILTAKSDNSLLATRFEKGKSTSSGTLTLLFNYFEKNDLVKSLNALTPSESNRNILYLALALNANKFERELFVGRFDFNKRTIQSIYELFDRKHAKEIEKNYMPINGNFDKPNIGAQRSQLRIKYFKEHNGKLITVMSENFFVFLNNVITYYEKASIINCYNDSLKLQFQQLFPIEYQYDEELTTGFNFGDKSFHILANNDVNFNPSIVYGQIDLLSGKWIKLQPIKNFYDYTADENIIWFKDNFIVPQLKAAGLFFTNQYRHNIALQSYFY